jgi:hypothetical protein
MKGLVYLVLGVSAVVVLGMVLKNKEYFVPEFLEQSGVKRTHETKDSSHEQRTNHALPQSKFAYPSDGVETPFRVNQFNAFVVA